MTHATLEDRKSEHQREYFKSYAQPTNLRATLIETILLVANHCAAMQGVLECQDSKTSKKRTSEETSSIDFIQRN